MLGYDSLVCLLIVVNALTASTSTTPAKEGDNSVETSRGRDGKVFNVFTVVRFPNDPCTGGSNNGTCYTEAECSSKGGKNDGSCAQGFGVCCTFTISCGQTSSENCTYFTSTGSEAGQCRVSICPCSNNICQLRLDFQTFVITGPNTISLSVAKQVNGAFTGLGGGKQVAYATRCSTDTFTVTNPGGGNYVPTICGTNTGDHIYLDSSSQCNDINFNLGSTAVGTTLATRSWAIKVTQYDCNYNNLAPQGCTQYFFGQTSNVMTSFNHAGTTPYHLADQNQNVCIRRETGICKMCFSAVADLDLDVSGKSDLANGLAVVTCCNYGVSGLKKSDEGAGDCVTIPRATCTANGIGGKAATRQCGRGGLQTKAGEAAGETQKTICTKRSPFSFRFISDSFEFAVGASATADEAALGNTGFKIAYIGSTCA